MPTHGMRVFSSTNASPQLSVMDRAGVVEKKKQFRLAAHSVVDDNVDAADSLAVVLRLLGQDVKVAYDGPAALETARV
jgi:hypothetical protein